MSSLEKYIQDSLESLYAKEQYRTLAPLPAYTSSIINFYDNDYFNLSTHPEVIACIVQAAESEGMGIRASRLLSRTTSYYCKLETLLAEMKRSEAALVFGSGYQTHIGIIPALASKEDVIIADKYIHASMLDGARLSGARLIRFAHNDPASCAILLNKYRAHYRHCLILTETVFSMDGDLAPLAALSELAQQHDALLVTDDAHGTNQWMPTTSYPSHLQMGTLSKALGCYGGYVCGSHAMISYLINTARSLIYSTALPTPVVAGAYAALLFLRNNIQLLNKPLEHARYFTQSMDLPDAQSPIVPYIVGTNAKATRLAQALYERGYRVPAIRPPTVPKNTARLRFTFSAAHTKKQIDQLVLTLKECE